jgi:hypothetical protein
VRTDVVAGECGVRESQGQCEAFVAAVESLLPTAAVESLLPTAEELGLAIEVEDEPPQ